MSNNYFERLSALARKLDKGIKELEDEWQCPRIFVGGCADVSTETEVSIESLKNSIKSTQDGVNELIRAKEISDSDIEVFIKEAQATYDTLKNDVDNLETVFEEYGYQCNTDNVNNSVEIKETEKTSDTNVSMEDNSIQEIIFTPDLSWRCKKKSTDKASLNGNEHLSEKSTILHTVPTNISNEVANTPKYDIQLANKMLYQHTRKYSSTHKQFLTPLRDRPRDPIYSKHFYSTLNKDFHL